MSQLSVVIIAHNEEENIGKCIESVKGIADEVVVVDSFSTDKTCDLAKGMGARVIQHAFEGHIQQKNWARGQATFNYVLSLDADESLSEQLRISIIHAKQDFGADGFTMNRLNFYCGKPIKTCGWYPDKKLRIWNNDKGQWGGINPHDKFEMNPDSTISHLDGDILHNTFPTPESYLKQVEKFATISASEMKDKNVLYLVYKMIFSPPFKFVRNYFFKLGFTEGSMGFTICFNQMREVFLKYFRAIKFKYAS
ncbi:MAG: glycosyltransferase family 2 protein [Candidatus Paceibacterales bacterium]